MSVNIAIVSMDATNNPQSAERAAETKTTRQTITSDKLSLDQQIDAACARIAPLWPLKHFVAVNPFFGLRDKTFQEASDTLARILGHGIYMSRNFYREQLAAGRISHDDVQQAIMHSGSGLDVATVERILAQKAPLPKMGMVDRKSVV